MTTPLSDGSFSHLKPDTVLAAVESQGHYCDARIYPLNSYENRVYQVGIEDAPALIAKFYRPARWRPEQIREEHQWSLHLAQNQVPVVAPLVHAGESLFSYQGYYFALYPRSAGTPVALDDEDHLYALGQALGQLHQQKSALFTQRSTLNPQSDGGASRDFLLSSAFLPKTLKDDYQALSDKLLAAITERFSQVNYHLRPLHGDFHIGNVLWQNGPWLVDFDDAQNGPAVQDMWMLLSGSVAAQQQQLAQVLEGYEEYCDFDTQELSLIPSLRALRLMNYSAWLARRWQDSAFPKAFPWFNGEGYWQAHLKQLSEALEDIKHTRYHRGQPL
ncbi:MAG: putative kinase [Pseudomonadota bacterium]|jgi:Ser/Thr protein kinase RdoA (MazF antagonist)